VSVVFRAVEPAEIPLVLDSWAKSWRQSDYAGTVPNHLFFATNKEMIGGLIARGAKLVAAAIRNRVAGWVCYEHKGDDTAVVHMVYVKDPYRRNELGREVGLGTELVDIAIAGRPKVFYTHKTRHSRYVLPKHAVWCPEIARRKAL
jgi:predicted GNAT superfamily acetyltransferase